MAHDATAAEVQEIAKALQTVRSPNRVRELARRYDVTEAFVVMIAESVVAKSFIFESAPAGTAQKGTPTMTPDQLSATMKVFQAHGTSQHTQRLLATKMKVPAAGIAEAAKAWDQVAAEAKPAVTETAAGGMAPLTSRDVREQYLAEKLAADVEAASAKPLAEATMQDLEALAAARWV